MDTKKSINAGTKLRYFSSICCIIAMVCSLAGCGAAEGAASNRGRYLTGLGYIYQPDEIQISSLIAKEDYDYPLPQHGPFNVTADADIRENTGFIQIGLKANKTSFAEISPMNICFVIDISGSMSERDKLSWVKHAFYIFINSVRVEDVVSVVIFDDKTEVLIPPTYIKDDNDRNQFKRSVDTLMPRGSTDILKGVSLGYTQVEKNFSDNYINRVILLTDGMHNGAGTKDDILDIVSRYNAQNIYISTIALGASADIDLMVDMGIKGGGSSRFISDYDQMEQAFGSELDRLVVPAARKLNMTLTLPEGVHLRETWGYKHWVDGSTIHYSLDTIHNGDYETIFAIVDFDKIPGVEAKIADFSVGYEDEHGAKHESELYGVYITPDCLNDLNSIVNFRVKKAEGFVAYGKALMEIGELANTIIEFQINNNVMNDSIFKDRLVSHVHNGLVKIRSTSAYLENINHSLGSNGYHDELTTLANYEAAFMELYDELTAAPKDMLKP